MNHSEQRRDQDAAPSGSSVPAVPLPGPDNAERAAAGSSNGQRPGEIARASAVIRAEHSGDSGVDSLRPMVADLRQRLASMASQELELQRREAQVQQQLAALERRAREAANRELEGARTRLEQRSNELDAQAIELAARRSHLDRVDAQLQARERKLEQAQAEVESASRRLQDRIEEEKRQRGVDRQTLTNRISIIRERERELERRVKLARDEIIRQRAELDERLGHIEQRAGEVETRFTDLSGQEAEWRRKLAAVELRDSEIGELREALLQERSAAAERGREYEAASGRLDAEREDLAQRQLELDDHWKQTRAQRSKALAQLEELSARQRAQQDQAAELDAREQRIAAQERQLAARMAALEADAARLSQRISELNARGRGLDEREQDIAARQREADHIRDEAIAQREQAELRDAETRQAALAAELESQNLARERLLIEQQHHEIAGLREERERELERAARDLELRSVELRRSELALFRGSKRWPLRAAVLSLISGAAAAAVLLALDRPSFRAFAKLHVSSAADPQRAGAEHAARLAGLGWLENAASSSEQARRLTGLRQARDLEAHVVADGVQLAVAGTDPQQAARIAADIAGLYEQQVNGVQPDEVTPGYADLLARQESTQAAVAEQQRLLDSAQAGLAALPAAGNRDERGAELAGLRKRHDELNAALAHARQELAGVLAGGDVRGSVTPEDVELALRSDTVYQEDTKEFRVAAREYQNELAIGMVLFVDPLKTARDGARAFLEALQEQHRMGPPIPMAAALEAMIADSESLLTEAADFAQAWDAARLAVEHMRVDEDVVELVQRQSRAADDARQFTRRAEALLSEHRRRIEEMQNQGAGGTREIVVLAQLRSAVAKLEEALSPLGKGAEGPDPTANFELDARDKKLRGLRTRMTARRDAVQEQLQAAADLAVQADRGAYTEELRVRTRAIEQERDTLVATLVERLDALREMDELAAQRQRHADEVDLRSAELRRLSEQSTALAAAIADARRSGPAPDRVRAGPVAVEQVGGLAAARNAVLAGAAAASATWLLCVLLLVRNPLRRPIRSSRAAAQGAA